MRSFLRRHPIGGFYGTALLVAWGCFGVVVGPKLWRGESMRPVDAFILFPLLVLSVAVLSFVCTRLLQGPDGTRSLRARMRRARVGAHWYAAALLIPPVVILGVLTGLGTFSRSYSPGFFGWGVLFGLFPGFFEEIGWTGFLYPRLRERHGALPAALLLGVLWAFWHAPVVNFLGAASPHGSAFWAFFLAFAGVLVAMRVLMVWVYTHTESVLLAQLMHASSTGCLVVFSPPHVTPAREALWYAVYAVVLGLVAAAVVMVDGATFRRTKPNHAPAPRIALY